jgi:hypothetical protein
MPSGYLPVAGLVPNLLDHFSAISKVTRAQPRLLAVLRVSRDNTTMALVNLNELLEEGLDGRWRGGWKKSGYVR